MTGEDLVDALFESQDLLLDLANSGNSCSACHVFNTHATDCKIVAQIRINQPILREAVALGKNNDQQTT